MGLYCQRHAFWAGGSLTDAVNGTAAFVVGHNGKLIANDAVIRGNVTATSGSFNGTITAQNGTIGGWTIGTNILCLPSYWGSSGLERWGTGVSSSSYSGDPAFYAGFGGNGGDPWSHQNMESSGVHNDGPWQNHTKFYVTNGGHLTAKDANITGTIKANKGNFGAWSLTNYSSNYGCMYAKDSNGYGVYLGNLSVTASRSDGDTESVSWDDIVFVAYNYSDERLKKDIIDFNASHDAFFDLIQTKEFRYNNQRMSGSVNKLHFGFIYQNIRDAAEQANINDLSLHWLKSDGYGNVNKQEFIALNTWQIQKLKKRTTAAERRIADLESTVAELKTQIQTLTAS